MGNQLEQKVMIQIKKTMILGRNAPGLAFLKRKLVSLQLDAYETPNLSDLLLFNL
jgi:hypothetical protein